MYKILLIDDEYLFLESLKMVIRKNFRDIDNIQTAVSGKEGIKIAIEQKPDIVFVDIQMPGISGTETIEKIKKINPDAYFVIVTAYEYFEYAKEAIELGVAQYLVKPVSKTKIIETLLKILEKIEEKKDFLVDSIEFEEKMMKINPLIESQYLVHKINGVETINSIEFYEDIFGMNLSRGNIICINGKNISDYFGMIRNYFKQRTDCIIANPIDDKIVIFIPETTDILLQKKILEDMKKNKIKFSYGIGRVYENNYLYKSYSESVLALSSGIYDESAYSRNIKNIEKVIVEKIISKDKNLNTFIDNYFLMYDKEILKTKVLKIVLIVSRILPSSEYSDLLSSVAEEYISSIFNTKSVNELKIVFLSFINDITYFTDKETNENEIIKNVINYIKENFSKDINLQDVAEVSNISYHYLSKMFKNATGKGFNEFLNEVRVKRALQLLLNPELSIKEVSMSVGIPDPNYFSKVFKKISGVSPSEYKFTKRVR